MAHTLRRGAFGVLLIAAAIAPLSAQGLGGDPISSSALLFMTIVIQAVRYLGVAAIAFGGLRWMFGRGDGEHMTHLLFGGAMAFGASLLATALFPGLAP